MFNFIGIQHVGSMLMQDSQLHVLSLVFSKERKPKVVCIEIEHNIAQKIRRVNLHCIVLKDDKKGKRIGFQRLSFCITTAKS